LTFQVYVELTFLSYWPIFFQNWPNLFDVLGGKQSRDLATLRPSEKPSGKRAHDYSSGTLLYNLFLYELYPAYLTVGWISLQAISGGTLPPLLAPMFLKVILASSTEQ
jgi:hypothetical protein